MAASALPVVMNDFPDVRTRRAALEVAFTAIDANNDELIDRHEVRACSLLSVVDSNGYLAPPSCAIFGPRPTPPPPSSPNMPVQGAATQP
jgi:hypothetical protein